MRTLLALADDLTGALEVGAKFAGSGIQVRVTTASGGGLECDVEVIDLESRHLPPEEAAAAVSRAIAGGACLIYKKTDSTLRGNIAAELRALAAAYPDSMIAYVPAYPAVGRTVKDGELYVYGVHVHRTAFAADRLNPIADSSIARIVADVSGCTVYDGENDADVARATASALADPACRIIAGPASVAAEIAAGLEGPGRRPVEPLPHIRRCLIVNGSLHDVSTRQIAFAEAQGCVSAALDAAWRILHSPEGGALPPLEFAAETGRRVREYLSGSETDALLVFGGDTAFGILKALGCPPLEPIGEVIMGVPVSRVWGRNLYLITKAGGFGGDDLICKVKQLLHGND